MLQEFLGRIANPAYFALTAGEIRVPRMCGTLRSDICANRSPA